MAKLRTRIHEAESATAVRMDFEPKITPGGCLGSSRRVGQTDAIRRLLFDT
jgi:hypothetical protein